MKKSITIFYLIITIINISFAQQAENFEFAQVYYKKQWRIIDKKGRFIFKNTKIETLQNLCISDQMIRFDKKGKVGFKNFENSVIIPPKYESAFCFYSGYAPIQLNKKWGIIDKHNKFLVEPIYDYIGPFYSDSLASVLQDGKLGFVNMEGELIIPCKYFWYASLNVHPQFPIFTEGLLAITLDPLIEGDSIRPKTGFINTKGEVQIEPKFDFAFGMYSEMPYFQNGKAIVSINNKYGVIDTKGNFIIRPKFDRQFYFNEGLAIVNIDKKYGVIDEKGDFILEPIEVNGINPFIEGYAVTQIKTTENGVISAFIDKNGKFAFGREFGFINDFSEKMAAVEIDGKWGYINQEGKLVIPPIYTSAHSFYNGLAIVVNEKLKCGFIDKQGNMAIPFKYNEAYEFAYGLAPVKIGGKFGYINVKNEMIIKPKFTNASSFQQEYINH